jgi:pimeloyl-ACP methyl ester carboxylesterase
MSVLRSTVVLVHGGWHGSWCWARVVPLLERWGLSVRTIDLPSIDADPYDRSALSGDAAAVTALLDDLREPALLCGHSYGGMVITQAAAGRQDLSPCPNPTHGRRKERLTSRTSPGQGLQRAG